MSALFSHPDRLLAEHLNGVSASMVRAVAQAPFSPSAAFGISRDELVLLARLIGGVHDLGKATHYFADKLQKRKRVPPALSSHSLIGAAFAFDAAGSLFKDSPLVPVCAFVVIRRHHGCLSDLWTYELHIDEEDIEVLEMQYDALNPEVFDIVRRIWGVDYDFSRDALGRAGRSMSRARLKLKKALPADGTGYLLINYLFSLLGDADRTDVVFRGEVIDGGDRGFLPFDSVDRYRDQRGWSAISGQRDELNDLRDQFYADVLANVGRLTGSERVLLLKAPTGIGKTLAVLSAALRLRDNVQRRDGHVPRIVYSLPFLNIIDQNLSVFSEVLAAAIGTSPSSELLLAHHHLTPLEYRSTKEQHATWLGEAEAEILISGWASEIVVTTFVSVFESMVTNRKSPNLHRWPGSIVILDEVQGIPTKYWRLAADMVRLMAEKWGTRFVFVTATMPLLFEEAEMTPLVSDPGRFFDAMNRYTLRFGGQKDLGSFHSELRNVVETAADAGRSCLVVANTIASSREIFENLGGCNADLMYLSSHVIPKKRMETIARLKRFQEEGVPAVLVSTQVVEAGVDLDFDLVIRDMAPFDSIIQAAGRCNRHGRRGIGACVVYELMRSDVPLWRHVYDRVLIDATRELLPTSQVEEQEVRVLVEGYFKGLAKRISADESRAIVDAVSFMKYSEVDGFSLIQQKGIHVPVFVEEDDEAESIWLKYQELMERRGADSMERRVRLKAMFRLMAPYLLSIRVSGAPELPPEQYGVYYVQRANVESGEWYDRETGFAPVWSSVI